ncbi:hypothetical protein HKX48_002334, partial [Thoreauomyces humboldtii]
MTRAAYSTLQAVTDHPPSRFLFARCCMDLDLLQEAESALRDILQDPDRLVREDDVSETNRDVVGADVLQVEHAWCLLGTVCKRSGKREDAKAAFRKALAISPFMWTAYEGLCSLGQAPEARDVFVLPSEDAKKTAGGPGAAETQRASTRNLRPRKDNNEKKRTHDVMREVQVKSETGRAENDTATAASSASRQILRTLETLGRATRHLSRYECREALTTFTELPESDLHTGWVLVQVALSYYEIARYTSALKYFRQARDLEPWRTQGLDVYGSCLWHAKQEIELAALATEMETHERSRPETWCVVGNLYSLRLDHDSAIKAFERAIHVDPYYHYAHTLMGFEYKSKDALKEAIECLQTSCQIDPRPYNPWFGLGEIYYNQENYHAARFHLDRAITINPRNPISHFHMGG